MKITVGFAVLAVLLVSVAQASYFTDKVTAIQQRVEAAIEAGISEVQTVVKSAQEKAEAVGEELKAKSVEFAQGILNQLRDHVVSVDGKIASITAKAGNIDVSECTAMGYALQKSALAAVSNMSSCVVDQIELGSGYIESIVKISDDVHANLTRLRDEARLCGEGVDSFTSSAKAIVCANLAAAKATWATAKGIPKLTADVAKLTYLLGTLHIRLPYCTATRGFMALMNESERVVAQVQLCVDSKISATTQQPIYVSTTEFPTVKHENINSISREIR